MSSSAGLAPGVERPKKVAFTSRAILLTRPLEIAARPSDGNALVHHPLADTEVLVEPLVNIFVFAGNLVCLEAGPGTSHKGGQ